MRDGYRSDVRVYKPPPSLASPLVVLIHGGGFCVGHNTQLAIYCRAIADLYGATFSFPTAPSDVWDSVQWLSSPQNAQSLDANLSAGFVIGGVSAGANLAAVTAQKWMTETSRPLMTGVWLAMPYLLEEDIVPATHKDIWFSRKQNSEALILNQDAIDYITAAYKQDIRSPDFSPFNVKGAHRGLPPVYFQVCGQDPLRDDGLVYERVLRENGVTTRLDLYPGVPHSYWDVFDTLKLSRRARMDIIKGLGWLLGKEEPLDEDCLNALSL
ncbi:Alpha/Beta hydrolase protein [Ilyonectria sp. MPI-CAGE-AT-0026]|nr:Alpha/Beta hydrolase protein [Ilyonectria sp. MPI-CAGE-AT-0026]